MSENNYEKRLKEMLSLDNEINNLNDKAAISKKTRQGKESAKLYVASICSRSEYCIYDIKEKLKKKQLEEDDINEIIEFLLKEKYIDESRYCRSFINDKYKYSKWGKIKIAYMLKAKRIPNELIYNSIDENINEEIYMENLERCLLEKKKSIKSTDKYETKAKLFRFASGRGYESDDISTILNRIL